ncbi:signal peptidase II [Gehongia tenuis]|uniref:signal peptidase II n=1 Tax=Gehongia tenuis TaxID=2763655 RepID=UPI002016055F|nr:signal peptidase II [Gehongia tenuis]
MSFLLIAALIVGLDQLTKYLAVQYLMPLPFGDLPLWKNVFHLTYTENYGAAFGLMEGARPFFLAITIIFVAVIIVYYFKNRKRTTRLFMLSLSFLVGGALGNFIDRLFQGYVVDFFYFKAINFAIFNVADMFVVIGGILLCACIIFGWDAKKPLPKDKPEEQEAAAGENGTGAESKAGEAPPVGGEEKIDS